MTTKPKATPAPRRDITAAQAADVVIPAVLDLGARAAARAKAKKVGPKVKIGAVTYDLPPELRLDTLRGVFKLVNGDIDGLDTLLFDLFPRDAIEAPTELELDALEDDKARAARRKAYNPAFKDLTLDDIGDLFTFVGDQYGIDLGKSPESTDS